MAVSDTAWHMVALREGTTSTELAVRPGYPGFLRFAQAVAPDAPLAPFQRKIARALHGSDREVVAVLPRGQAKSTTAALVAVHHVLTTPNPSVFVGAGSRQQARVIGRIVERLAHHPLVAAHGIDTKHDELRTGLRETVLSIVASDGGKAHGWERPTLMIGDEVWQWSDREPTLLGAMMTALIKNRDARLLLISTPAASLDSPLGRLRARALAQPTIVRKGAHIDASGRGLRWLEWSLPEDREPSDTRAVKSANPAPWITAGELAQQRERVTEPEWLQFHCARWGVGEGTWLPPGAWAACRTDSEPDPDEPVWLGVDVGGTRAATCVIGVTADLHVAEIHVWQGNDAVLSAAAAVAEIADRRPVVEVVYDPWRFASEAMRLEREHGLRLVEFPQSASRMTRASEGLHAAIVQRRLQHPAHPELDQHIASAIARRTGRGFRLDKAIKDDQIDGAIALAMAVERAEYRPEPVQLLGWI